MSLVRCLGERAHHLQPFKADFILNHTVVLSSLNRSNIIATSLAKHSSLSLTAMGSVADLLNNDSIIPTMTTLKHPLDPTTLRKTIIAFSFVVPGSLLARTDCRREYRQCSVREFLLPRQAYYTSLMKKNNLVYTWLRGHLEQYLIARLEKAIAVNSVLAAAIAKHGMLESE